MSEMTLYPQCAFEAIRSSLHEAKNVVAGAQAACGLACTEQSSIDKGGDALAAMTDDLERLQLEIDKCADKLVAVGDTIQYVRTW